MRQKQKGFVLIFVSILLGISTILLLSQLSQFVLQHKMINSKVQATQVFQRMEKGIRRLTNQALSTASGEIAIDKQVFLYTVVHLGLYPCLRIGFFPSHHWQIRLTTKTTNPLIMSIRIATVSANQANQCKSGTLRFIKPGVQSWNDL